MNNKLAWGLSFCLLLLTSGSVLALAPAGMTVDSGLNQPLKARITLLNATAAELASLKVSRSNAAIAGRDLEFRIETDSAGQALLWVTTSQPVREPALSFVLEFVWDGGRLLREYSVLLDPQ